VKPKVTASVTEILDAKSAKVTETKVVQNLETYNFAFYGF